MVATSPKKSSLVVFDVPSSVSLYQNNVANPRLVVKSGSSCQNLGLEGLGDMILTGAVSGSTDFGDPYGL